MEENENDKALEILENLPEVNDDEEDILLTYKRKPTYDKYAAALVDEGKFDEAIQYYIQGLEWLREIYHDDNYQMPIASCYNSLGDIHKAKGDYESALECYSKSMKYGTEAYIRLRTAHFREQFNI